jgi:hypothetical protein
MNSKRDRAGNFFIFCFGLREVVKYGKKKVAKKFGNFCGEKILLKLTNCFYGMCLKLGV